MISKKTKYALNALTYLARHHQEGPVLISAIAQSERIPGSFWNKFCWILKTTVFCKAKRAKAVVIFSAGRHKKLC